jgi:hypothetical protein
VKGEVIGSRLTGCVYNLSNPPKNKAKQKRRTSAWGLVCGPALSLINNTADRNIWV